MFKKPRGLVVWVKDADGYTLTVAVPEGMTAEVVFGGDVKTVSGGIYSVTMYI